MTKECAIDTTVLQKANAPLLEPPGRHSLFRIRLRLLERIHQGSLRVLISRQLQQEYDEHVKSPRNDFVTAFLSIIDNPERSTQNWARWPSREQEKARECKYPKHDDHVLRTAIRTDSKTILFTEENALLATDTCIYKHFRVHIWHPKSVSDL